MLHFQNENYAYFRTIWQGNLRQVLVPQSIKSSLPGIVVDFLEQVGLPLYNREIYSGFDFSEFDDQFKTILFQGDEYFLIGRNIRNMFKYYDLVSLHKLTGNLFLLHTEFNNLLPLSDHPVNFVNSGLVQYLASLVAFYHYKPVLSELLSQYYEKYARLPHLSDDEALAVGKAIQSEVNIVVENIKYRLKVIDPRSIESFETYWSQLLFNYNNL